MIKSKNVFVCIGALHYDYLLKLKKNILNYRTNPISQETKIGGVAYNVAKLLSLYSKVDFYTLKISDQLKKEVNNKNIMIHQLNNKNLERYYVALSNNKNKFILGLANTDVYEKKIDLDIKNKIEKKNIILDLNLSKIFINKIIKKLSQKNKIIICATSVHKVYKIKNIIKKIDLIFLNNAELKKLTNSQNLILGIKKLLKKNKNITVCVTNGKKNVIYANKKIITKIKPPKILIKNENGAGDALAAMMINLISLNYSHVEALKYSVACGSYYASGKNLKNINDFIKIKKLSKKMLIG